jgi:hypothetical protein
MPVTWRTWRLGEINIRIRVFSYEKFAQAAQISNYSSAKFGQKANLDKF